MEAHAPTARSVVDDSAAARGDVTSPEVHDRRRFRRRTIVGVAALFVVTLTIAATVIAWLPRQPAPAAEGADISTATITRGTLVEVANVSGTLGYGPEHPVESRLSGTVTALAAVGSTVVRGKALFRIDDKPVILLYGGLPAYRDLTAGHPAPTPDPTGGAGTPGSGPPGPGTGGGGASDPAAAVPASKGADVKEFEENLKALGYSGFTVDDAFTEQTAQAVRRWQKDLGLDPTGVVELGRVIYASGPVRVAQQTASPGAVATGPVLTCTGTTRLVTADVPVRQEALAKVNTNVTIVLPSGDEVPGTVRSVAGPPADQAAQGQEPTVSAIVSADDPAAVDGLDDGPAQVRFKVQQRTNVLMVPVGALLALAEGGYGLEIIENGSTRVVAVNTGLFANGNVEVSGPDIHAGMVVGMAR